MDAAGQKRKRAEQEGEPAPNAVDDAAMDAAAIYAAIGAADIDAAAIDAAISAADIDAADMDAADIDAAVMDAADIDAAMDAAALDAAIDAADMDAAMDAAADQQEEPDVHNPNTALQLVEDFVSRLRLNLEARTQHPKEPALFLDSELALHHGTERLHLLAGAPEHFWLLEREGHLTMYLNHLLIHDNPDLVVVAASLIDDLMNSDEPPGFLHHAFVEFGALGGLVSNLFRFSNEAEGEAEAIHQLLVLLEHFIDLSTDFAKLVCFRTDILYWLSDCVKKPYFDATKGHASEILAILLQSSRDNQKIFGRMGGIGILLEAIALYERRDPETPDEEEMLDDLFNSLCCVLMPVKNKERFLKAEGLELMIIIMEQKKYAYSSAIRTLDFVMTRFPPACDRFVDILGLDTTFAAFMDEISVNKENKNVSSLEERIISVISSLFGGITNGARRITLLEKFADNDCEKIDLLMELYTRYSDRVKAETERLESLDFDELKMDDDDQYNRKLEAGLYTLQLVALILGHIWLSGNSQMRIRIELLYRKNKLTKDDVKGILEEYHDSIGDLDGRKEKRKTKGCIREIIAAL